MTQNLDTETLTHTINSQTYVRSSTLAGGIDGVAGTTKPEDTRPWCVDDFLRIQYTRTATTTATTTSGYRRRYHSSDSLLWLTSRADSGEWGCGTRDANDGAVAGAGPRRRWQGKH